MTMHQAQTAAPEAATPHTPLPWTISYGFDTRKFGGEKPPATYVAPSDPEQVGIKLASPWVEGAWDDDEEAAANAEFITRACNSHDELLGVLRTVCAILDDYRAPGDELPAFEDPSELVNELEKRGVHEAITAAIASATGAA